ncbi:MAG: cpdA [Rhodospirillales bacterium]|nr:cpdA [Rhodospirillales bacterium]
MTSRFDDDETVSRGTSRREALTCMAWAGTGLLWSLTGGVPLAGMIGRAEAATPSAGFTFAQFSDSHLGFNKEANTDPVATLRVAIADLAKLPTKPAFIIHTGDISHLSKPAEFDMAAEVMKETGLPVFYVPGEHDVLTDEGVSYRERFAPKAQGDGWFSFDHDGVHFVGLVNVQNLKAGGLGNLGNDQLAWLASDLKPLKASTPIVVFAHIPLWTVYAEWGWGTEDSSNALSLLARFGSVTVLNGHIHQIMQKVEGKVAFHTARSTAFPQPAPGTAPSAGPMKVPPGELKNYLGTTDVTFVRGHERLAIVDHTLV